MRVNQCAFRGRDDDTGGTEAMVKSLVDGNRGFDAMWDENGQIKGIFGERISGWSISQLGINGNFLIFKNLTGRAGITGSAVKRKRSDEHIAAAKTYLVVWDSVLGPDGHSRQAWHIKTSWRLFASGYGGRSAYSNIWVISMTTGSWPLRSGFRRKAGGVYPLRPIR
jgi:hypothetical protein